MRWFLILCIYLVRHTNSQGLTKIFTSPMLQGKASHIGGPTHDCYRDCVHGESKTCVYNFTVSHYTTMSNQCRDCPYTQEDCFRPMCITAGGGTRGVSVVNQMLPGPAILVCVNDRVIVNVQNEFTSDSTIIHWHGVHQTATPWMDGVPYVTQCPILPHNSFEYNFIADTPGTHMWHGHIGFQEADGLHGQLVVRQPSDVAENLYDYDLPEHTIMIWHWTKTSTMDILQAALHQQTGTSAYDLIINGKSAKNNFTKDDHNYTTPVETFTVKKNKRYRFRTIFNSAINCPIQFSIVAHNLTMIATDSGEFDPVNVESFIASAGERYDFVLEANQDVAAYWMRFRGLGICKQVKIHQIARLQYENSDTSKPYGSPTHDGAFRTGKILNVVNQATESYPDNQIIKITDLNSSTPTHDISGKTDETIYMTFKFGRFTGIHTPGPYPQINGTTFSYPESPLLTQWENLKPGNLECPKEVNHYNCIDDYCTCPFIYSVKKNALVEIILVDVDTSVTADHPMHLHGGHFHVVASESVGKNISLEYVRKLNAEGKIDKKLQKVVYKDTVSVPSMGFTILRYIASNPGYWIFHCHFTNHAELGMAMVMKIGERKEMMQAPNSFPKCGNWAYKETESSAHVKNVSLLLLATLGNMFNLLEDQTL